MFAMLRLTRHPTSPDAPIGVEAEATRSGARLALRYRLSGVAGVVLPLPAICERTDELWRHTCFEAFVSGGAGYVEINLSPSAQWAAYRFDGYRQGMAAAETQPRIEVRRVGDDLELDALVDLNGSGLDDLDWRVGLSAVVEGADGGLSYWALKHPPGKPDFHHGDCFALELSKSRGP